MARNVPVVSRDPDVMHGELVFRRLERLPQAHRRRDAGGSGLAPG